MYQHCQFCLLRLRNNNSPASSVRGSPSQVFPKYDVVQYPNNNLMRTSSTTSSKGLSNQDEGELVSRADFEEFVSLFIKILC